MAKCSGARYSVGTDKSKEVWDSQMNKPGEGHRFDSATRREIRHLAQQVIHAYAVGIVILLVLAGLTIYGMRDRIVAEAKRALIDSIKPSPADVVPDGWRILPWVREPGEGVVDCSECRGAGTVHYGRDHWMVTRLGTAPGTYVCPLCSGSGRLTTE